MQSSTHAITIELLIQTAIATHQISFCHAFSQGLFAYLLCKIRNLIEPLPLFSVGLHILFISIILNLVYIFLTAVSSDFSHLTLEVLKKLQHLDLESILYLVKLIIGAIKPPPQAQLRYLIGHIHFAMLILLDNLAVTTDLIGVK